MNSFQSSPLHVAQQSRRDKLRFNQLSPAENPDLTQLNNMSNHSPPTLVGGDGQTMFTSGLLMHDFSSGSQSNHNHPTEFMMAAAAASVGGGDWTINCANHGYNNGYDHHLSSSTAFDNNCSGQGHRQFDLTQLQPFGSSPSTLLDHGNHPLASIVRQTQIASAPWMDVSNSNSELVLLPNSNLKFSSRVSNNGLWVTRETQNCSSSGGLSLSLSSSFPTEVPIVPYNMRFPAEEAYPLNPIPPTGQIANISMPDSSNPSPTIRNPPTQDGVMGSSADNVRGVGPLGPFTGYATILQASKYLKPAQQLLDDSCTAAVGSKLSSSSESCRMLFLNGKDVNVSDGISIAGGGGGSKEGESSSGGCNSQIHQNKAKLLFMKGEVCRRYRHYNQQMQMAISSFESVAGLSTAMPFLSMALKTISKHFRFLRNSISDQLQSISRSLGEEFVDSSRTPAKVESAMASGLKFFDQTLRKQMEEANGLGLMEHNQPVWRPQRGLPERAVAVLRAWLFDHFLHPYPTDTDKLMLANQTGLSRNQVSNWFINARVRVWKPMVEEIHHLETKGLAEVDLNSSKCDRRSSSSSTSMLNQQEHQQQQQPKVTVLPNSLEGTGGHQWHQDHKRTRIEDIQQQQQVMTADAGGVMASFPSFPGGFDMGELGGVSLTLGLRREDGSNRQQQQIRSYFGTHLVQEFVG